MIDQAADGGSRWIGGEAARGGWGRRQGIHSPEDRRFVGLAAAAIDDFLARNPVLAVRAADTRFDDRLPDFSADGVAEQVRALNRHLLALDSIDPMGLSRGNAVDLAVLRRHLRQRVYRLRTLDEPTWNPLWWSPAVVLEPLFARPEPPVAAILSRLRAMGDHLESARASLKTMSTVHVEQALAELNALPEWLVRSVERLGEQEPAAAGQLRTAALTAASALDEYRRWMASRLPRADRDPRLGAKQYAGLLALIAGQGEDGTTIARAARAELEELHEHMRSLASRQLGRSLAARRLVPSALAAVASQYSVPEGDLVAVAARSVDAARAFTEDHRLASVPDVEFTVQPLPAVRAGRLSMCSERLGDRGGRTWVRIMVGGPEPGWAPSRRASYLREYNAVMLGAVMAGLAIPGRALLQAQSRSLTAPTAVRVVFPDPVLEDGWAGYAVRMLSDHGYRGAAGATASAYALEQVKLRMRAVAGALLDIGYHTGELDEPQARRLLATSSMAEEAESVAMWRRVRTSPGGLAASFTGPRDVAALVDDIQRSGPTLSLRQVHDRVLMHGAVPPAAVRDLLGMV